MKIRDVLATIIKQIEDGAGVWQMPWHGRNALPLCVKNGRKYSGINWLILVSSRLERGYTSRYWGTFNQWRARRQSVAAGQKGTVLIRPEYMKRLRPAWIPESWRMFHVFNGDQVVNRNEGHPDLFGNVASLLPSAEAVVARTRAQIRVGGHYARYHPSHDFIEVPEPAAFIATATSTPTQNYYSTVLHELVHWTGHSSRENRLVDWAGSREKYAFEELVAELGAAMLCAELELEAVPRPDHAQYLGSWLSALKGDATILSKATGLASKAAERIMKMSPSASHSV